MIGAVTMKITSNTNMTSTKGVTLMFDNGNLSCPWLTSAAMAQPFSLGATRAVSGPCASRYRSVTGPYDFLVK